MKLLLGYKLVVYKPAQSFTLAVSHKYHATKQEERCNERLYSIQCNIRNYLVIVR